MIYQMKKRKASRLYIFFHPENKYLVIFNPTV